MVETAIYLNNVTFDYEGSVTALRDLNLTAQPGEFIVVLGANGAGKSTLCYLLSGIVPQIYGGSRTGDVAVAGRDPWDDPLYITAQRCGVLLQDPEVQLFMPTLRTEVAFGPANLGVPREEIVHRIHEALSLVRLEGLEQRNPRDLSGGQKQRAALASVLALHPKVLVLDEPTSQLDPLGRSEVLQALHNLKSMREVTLLMTTHETDDVLDLADEVIVLKEGSIVSAGPPEKVFTEPEKLEEAGVKPPTLVHTLVHFYRQSHTPFKLKREELNKLDATRIGEQISNLIDRKRLEVLASPAPSRPTASTPARPVVIEALNLTYRYPGYPPVTALQNVNMTIREGEFVGIIGQNGSGKSTLVKSFVGLLRPTQGEVRVLGENILQLSVGQMARRVGMVLQNPDYQLFTISSREEILFGLHNLGIDGEEAAKYVEEALHWVNLEAEIETFPFRLSFGDRRKLAVAATVALDPKVLIMDEPTTAQDHRGRYQLAEIARRFREEKNRTAIMITHDMELAAHYAERLIVMWNGQILLDGSTAEVFEHTEVLNRTFLRPPVVSEIAHTLADYGLPRRILTTEQLFSTLGGPA